MVGADKKSDCGITAIKIEWYFVTVTKNEVQGFQDILIGISIFGEFELSLFFLAVVRYVILAENKKTPGTTETACRINTILPSPPAVKRSSVSSVERQALSFISNFQLESVWCKVHYMDDELNE
uniref:Uncharacterized protein n=1 Tax=Glossina austeni TaxID=7395 RepID=A0A1A9UT36_GLOAU